MIVRHVAALHSWWDVPNRGEFYHEEHTVEAKGFGRNLAESYTRYLGLGHVA